MKRKILGTNIIPRVWSCLTLYDTLQLGRIIFERALSCLIFYNILFSLSPIHTYLHKSFGMFDSVTNTYVNIWKCPLHQFISLTRGPIPEICAKILRIGGAGKDIFFCFFKKKNFFAMKIRLAFIRGITILAQVLLILVRPYSHSSTAHLRICLSWPKYCSFKMVHTYYLTQTFSIQKFKKALKFW